MPAGPRRPPLIPGTFPRSLRPAGQRGSQGGRSRPFLSTFFTIHQDNQHKHALGAFPPPVPPPGRVPGPRRGELGGVPGPHSPSGAAQTSPTSCGREPGAGPALPAAPPAGGAPRRPPPRRDGRWVRSCLGREFDTCGSAGGLALPVSSSMPRVLLRGGLSYPVAPHMCPQHLLHISLSLPLLLLSRLCCRTYS